MSSAAPFVCCLKSLCNGIELTKNLVNVIQHTARAQGGRHDCKPTSGKSNVLGHK